MSYRHVAAGRHAGPALTPISRALRMAFVAGLMLGGSGIGMSVAQAQTSAAARSYNIPAGPLDRALNSFAASAGVELSADASLLQGKNSQGLNCTCTVEQGFNELLRGQGLQASRQANGSFTLARQDKSSATEAAVTLPTATAVGHFVSAGDLPEAYAGGQVARGARIGALGNVDIMDTPFNVTAYTAQTMADQQANTVADVLRNDPSVRFTTSDGHNAENITIRGFEVNSSELALNGMYGMLPGAHVPTEFLERVEVFRGPAAMLSGIAPSGAVGGVINLVPKRAGDTPVTSVTTSFEFDSRLGLALDVGRRLGEDERLGVRFNGSTSYGETMLEGQDKRENVGFIGLDYRGKGWKMELDAYSMHQNQYDGSPLMYGFTGALKQVIDAPDPKKNALLGTYAKQRTEGVAVRGELELTRQLTAYAALGDARYTYDGYINGTRVVLASANGNATGQTYNQAGYTHGINMEGGLRGSFSTGPVAHQVVASASSLQVTNGLAAVATSASYTTNIYDPISNPRLAGPHGAVVRTADNDFTSLSLADTLTMLDDKLMLTLGLRKQNVEQKLATPKAYEADAITPMVGLVVKPWGAQLSLYANYIEGLSPGVTVGTAYANAGETLEPYKTKQAETGVKWEHSGEYGTFTNTFSLFRIERPSTISVSTGATLPTLAVDGEQRNQGLEWNVFGQIIPSVRVLGGVAYTQGELVRAATAANNGKQAPGVPEWTANLGAEWDLPWAPGLTLNLRATYTDAQYLDPANTLEIPSWTRWDLGARYRTRAAGKPLTLRFSVENLSDEHYWSGRFNDGFATLGAGRTVKMSATMDF